MPKGIKCWSARKHEARLLGELIRGVQQQGACIARVFAQAQVARREGKRNEELRERNTHTHTEREENKREASLSASSK